MIAVKYKEIKRLIKEGDVLLFRSNTLIGSLISKLGGSIYSHVGIASWSGKILECIEFREWKGGRTVSLDQYVKQYPGLIDVYRPVRFFAKHIFNPQTKKISYIRKEFNGRKVTNTMRKMTGLPYGWLRILWISKFKLAGLRLYFSYKDLTNDALHDIIYPVCSTSTAYSFNKYGYDLINNKSDEWTEPGDIARSSRLSGLFNLL